MFPLIHPIHLLHWNNKSFLDPFSTLSQPFSPFFILFHPFSNLSQPFLNDFTICERVEKGSRNDPFLPRVLGLTYSTCSRSEINDVLNWTYEEDVQLMQWATEAPSDWQVGGKCSAYLFGNGRSGQLADAGNCRVSSTRHLTQRFLWWKRAPQRWAEI